MFLFSCYTGLTYTELKELTKNHIVIGMDGKNWIYTKRAKTNEPIKAPLLHKADSIHRKYKEQRFDLDSKYLFRYYLTKR